jgi:hypothetical protein
LIGEKKYSEFGFNDISDNEDESERVIRLVEKVNYYFLNEFLKKSIDHDNIVVKRELDEISQIGFIGNRNIESLKWMRDVTLNQVIKNYCEYQLKILQNE